jgi:hypothetical protein
MHEKPTKLSIDTRLARQVLELSGASSLEEAVSVALQEFIENRTQANSPFANLKWESFDYKAERDRGWPR